MDQITLGKTELTVSVAGIGTGGPSQVGKRYGATREESVAVIRAGLDAGVTFIDTAEAYGTEDVVGRAIEPYPRESLVISTKLSRWEGLTAAGVAGKVEESLRKLGTDYVDVYHVHAATAEHYPWIREQIVPALQKEQAKGAIRFLGITESFNSDPGHEMLELALADDVWDVMMVGFNILNQSARERVFPKTREKNIGVLIMFAVRLALSRPQRLEEVIAELVARGQVDPDMVDLEDPLGFLRETASTVVDAAYRFVRHEPGVHVTLTGTGSVDHMIENIRSIQNPPLPPRVAERLSDIFKRVDSVSAQ